MITWEQIFSHAWERIITVIFGNPLLAGLWVILTILGASIGFGLPVAVAILLIIPITIGFMATGLIPLGAGAFVILVASFILAFSWWQNK